VPHLKSAILLGHRLRLAEQHAAGLATVIERLDQGAIVTDAEGRLLIVNARAAQILERGDGLSSINGELRASTHALTEQLKSSITTMAADLAGGDGNASLPRVSSRLPLVLTLMPIWRLGASPPGRRAPRVVIFVKEPDAPVHVDRSQLADTFGLTPRECDVALSLADEMDLGAVSAALDLKIGTTRVLLKRVFEKTGVHSQAALVTLVRSLGR
jgi:DNA-binding CsgD family transcriptional regulator